MAFWEGLVGHSEVFSITLALEVIGRWDPHKIISALSSLKTPIVSIRIFHEPDSAAASILILCFTILALLNYRRMFLGLLRNKHIWGVVALLYCFTMISGYTWNKIRNPAFYLKDYNGPVLISRYPRHQFLAESYIVAVLNAATVIGMILSIEGAQRKGKKVLFVAGLALMFASFASLLAVFIVKNPWYYYGFQ